MAKKAYIGVDGVARKVKKGYVGVLTDVPIYKEEIGTVSITASNLSEYFTVTNGSTYYFAGSGSTFTSNNKGKNSTSATSTWKAKYDMSAVSFSYSVSSESNYDKLTIKVKGTAVASAISGTSSSTWSGSLSAGDTIELTYSKDSSSASGDDCGTLSAMSITTTVKTQVGTETKGIARKIKKAYIGIGGVARPCWSNGELAYYGTITALSGKKSQLAAASNGSYALFGGGHIVDDITAQVDAYDASLVRSSATSLREAKQGLGATSVGSYVLFYGGDIGGGSSKTVDAYNTSLTRTSPTDLSGYGGSGSTSIGDYAVIGGIGSTGIVNAYNKTLTRSVLTALSQARKNLAATSVGVYALFGGGYDSSSGSNFSTVDAYDTSLTRTTATNLSLSRRNLGAASVGNYALFSGGSGSSSSAGTRVDAYDTSLTRTTATNLGVDKYSLAATSLEGYALFGSGNSNGTNTYTTVVDAYDASLTRTAPTGLSVARSKPGAATIGNFALFGGGAISTTTDDYSNAVDAYTAA